MTVEMKPAAITLVQDARKDNAPAMLLISDKETQTLATVNAWMGMLMMSLKANVSRSSSISQIQNKQKCLGRTKSNTLLISTIQQVFLVRRPESI